MTDYPQYLTLAPRQLRRHELNLPGSKSISNRVLLLSALAQGETQLSDVLASEDTQVMLEALKTLGVNWREGDAPNRYVLTGLGDVFPVKNARLFMGNAGTAIRPLAAVLALSGGHYHLHGVPRMHERPIGDLVNALNEIGANMTYAQNAGYPPLDIAPADIFCEQIAVKGNVSSQFLTALLLASPLIARDKDLRIDVVGGLISQPYIDITCQLMARFGVRVETVSPIEYRIAAGQKYRSPGTLAVEGDASSASYFLAAGVITGQAMTVHGVGAHSIQGDVQFARVLQGLGAAIEFDAHAIRVLAHRTVLIGQTIDCLAIPDAAMTLAMLALYAKGSTRLNNIGSWRVKETDRIAAMACELKKLGATIEAGADYLVIHPPKQLQPAQIDTYQDHRMAMCFSLASLNGVAQAGTSVTINDPSCVAKTYPEFFRDFIALTETLTKP